MKFEEKFPSLARLDLAETYEGIKRRIEINFNHASTTELMEHAKDFRDNMKWHMENVIQKFCIDKQRVKEIIDYQFLFSERKKLEDEFIQWSIKHKAENCPMNVIAWFYGKMQNKLRKELGLE